MKQLYPHSCLDGMIDNEFSTDNTKIFLDNMDEDTYPKFLKHVVEVITKCEKYLDGLERKYCHGKRKNIQHALCEAIPDADCKSREKRAHQKRS